MAYSVHQGELHAPDTKALLDLHVAAMRAQSPEDACHVMPANALDQPAISFFTLRDGGDLVAMGALKALGNDEGEVKSMRVQPARLGQGAGRAMLDALVAEARRRGYRRLLLETGTGLDFAAANALYDRSGFRECGPFGGYPPSNFTRFLALHL